MTTTRRVEDKTILLRAHPCVNGLREDAVAEIAEACELIRVLPGDSVHRANEVVTSLFLVIQGRLRTTFIDAHGNVILEQFQVAGGQFGGLAAATAEPTPVDCIAEDPTTLLRLGYEAALQLTRRHAAFRTNLVRSMAESVKQTLLRDRHPVRPPLVAVFHQSEETRIVSRRLFERLVSLGETPCVLTNLPDWDPVAGTLSRCVVEDGHVLEPEVVRRQVNEWRPDHRVFADMRCTFDRAMTANALEVCDQILWCVTPENHDASVETLREYESQWPALREKMTIVWLLVDERGAPLAPELRQLARGDLKISFRAPGARCNSVLGNGLERLVHLVRGVRIGVALGGGAARGMAHLGVLKALEREGIAIDMIAGTSAGAMVGTLYASGMDMDYASAQFAHDLTPPWIFRRFRSGEQWSLLYKYRWGRFDPLLRKYLDDLRIEQLALPMHAVAADLIGGCSVVRETGDAVHAIVESINLPGMSPPINRDGRALVDGGLINNVPADELINRGCNFVIAVSVTSKLEREFVQNRPDTPTASMKSASTLQTLLRAYLVQSASLNSIGVAPYAAVHVCLL